MSPKKPAAAPPPPPSGERRLKRSLREALDDLVGHTRDVARRAETMTAAELDYAQQRLQWLADEVWRAATGNEPPPPRAPGSPP